MDPKSETINSLPRASYWTEGRLEISAWLAKKAPSLAEVYRGAVDLTFGTPIPGRVRFICHAVREIRNRLPDTITGKEFGGRYNYTDAVSEIAEGWKNQTASERVNAGEPSPAASDGVQIPRSTFNLIEQLISSHQATGVKPTLIAAELFRGLGEAENYFGGEGPLIALWLKTTEWFVVRVHDNGKLDSEHNWRELTENFEIFESSLLAMAREFFTHIGDLDEILEQANR